MCVDKENLDEFPESSQADVHREPVDPRHSVYGRLLPPDTRNFSVVSMSAPVSSAMVANTSSGPRSRTMYMPDDTVATVLIDHLHAYRNPPNTAPTVGCD